MLQLFLSGSLLPNTISTPKQSLGGFVSSVLVTNDSFNNIFEDEEYKNNNENSYKMIVLKNTGNSNITIQNISVESVSQSFSYKISLVTSSLDECGRIVFESIQSSKSKPFYVDFRTSFSNVSINQSTYLGLWIERTKLLVQQVNNNINGNCNCTTLLEDFEVLQSIEESFQININY